MNYEVSRKFEVNLELTQEEFNTILAAVGKSNQGQREEFGDRNNLEVLSESETQALYSDMMSLALRLN